MQNRLEPSQADGVVNNSSEKYPQETHSLIIGYLLWVFGFTGSHRLYYGKPISGILYFCTLGLFFIGWFIDLFLMPSLDRQANARFEPGPISYNLTWILLTFFGVLGFHRFYMGKWISGFIYLFTVGLFGFGVLYDFLNVNSQVELENVKRRT